MQISRRIFVFILAAGVLGASILLAADKESAPLRAYRNDTYKFSFQYGEDEEITTSLPDRGGIQGVPKTDLWLLIGPQGQPGYNVSITIGHGSTEEVCNFPNDSYRINKKLNDFFVADPVKMGVGSRITEYEYRLFRNGHCFAIGAYDIEHKEFVKSFRFLDREPKAK